MKLTREQTAKNRETIVESAARQFRERGFGGVAVAELMNEAGFTHGGFYNHFASKEALAAEACARAMIHSNAELAERLLHDGRGAWRRYVEGYLSPAHRDDPAHGCTLGALAGEAGHQPREVQASFAVGVSELVALLSEWLRGGENSPGSAESRLRAIQICNELVGTLMLSRSVVAADRVLADEILAAGRKKLARL